MSEYPNEGYYWAKLWRNYPVKELGKAEIVWVAGPPNRFVWCIGVGIEFTLDDIVIIAPIPTPVEVREKQNV